MLCVLGVLDYFTTWGTISLLHIRGTSLMLFMPKWNILVLPSYTFLLSPITLSVHSQRLFFGLFFSFFNPSWIL